MERAIDGVLILAGPTCSGKTALAVELAETFGAEIVGADSRQMYRGMPIGTAAPNANERARVPHHLVGFLDPHERYSAARYAEDAVTAIAAIRARGKRVIVAGGTGFYVRALAGDVALSAVRDQTLRDRLAREATLHPPEVMHAWLAARDPGRANALVPGDRYRVLRALEIALAPRNPAPEPALASLRTAHIPYVKYALVVAPDELARRISERVDAMLRDGLLDEAERIGSGAVAADAVGYPQALAYLAGWSSFPELRAALARATRRYAKRQNTWLRSEPNVRWATHDEVRSAVPAVLGWRAGGP